MCRFCPHVEEEGTLVPLSVTRRSLLRLAAFSAIIGWLPVRAIADEFIALENSLCSYWFSLRTQRARYSSQSGDPVLDRQLSTEAFRISDRFGINPGLKFFVDGAPARNAFATPSTVVQGTKGTVFLGRDLVFQALNENRRGWGGLTVAGILAHEFAHIYQFGSGWRKRLQAQSKTVEPTELHADFLAGYYIGTKRNVHVQMDIGAFMDGIYILGDYDSSAAGHHGTPDERRRAVREGYRIGVKRGVQDISTIAREGYQQVIGIMKMSA